MADGVWGDDGALPAGGWERGHDPGALDRSATGVVAAADGLRGRVAGWVAIVGRAD